MPKTKRRLPSLTALTAFEAAARHLSFKAAAGELNVTPAAVSRQIRNLEEDVGARLFHRLYRGVKLTPDGELLFETVTAGFTNIAATVDSIRSAPSEQRLSVGSTNAVASFWLLPPAQAILGQTSRCQRRPRHLGHAHRHAGRSGRPVDPLRSGDLARSGEPVSVLGPSSTRFAGPTLCARALR